MKQISFLLWLTAITSSPAAPITWQAAANTSGKADLIEGAIITALNGSNVDSTISNGGASGTSNYFFATSNYTTINFAATGADAGDTARAGFGLTQYAPEVMLTTGDTDFDALISTASFSFGTPSGIVTGTMTLEGLTVGTAYQVQLFFNEQRHTGLSTSPDLRVMIFGDGAGNTTTVAGGDPAAGVQTDHYGQFVIGSFTADATTQELTMDSSLTEGFGNVHYNAILLTGPEELNVAPQLADAAFEILDGTPADTLITTLVATDGNMDDTLAYTITAGDPAGVFTLNSATGELKTTNVININDGALYNLTVEVSDGTATTTAATDISVIIPVGMSDIVWGPVQNTSSVTDLLSGTPVFARNGGDTTVTVAGINFKILSLGLGSSGAYGGGGIISTGDVDFDTLISTFSYGGGSGSVDLPGHITGLTPGKRYSIQVFFSDQRAAQSSRIMAFADGNGNSVDVGAGATLGTGEADDYGQFAIGEFVASGTSQILKLAPSGGGFGNSHFNAILVSEAVNSAGDGRVTDITFTPATNEVTLTWDSTTGSTYAIKYSLDLTSFEFDIDDPVQASAGDSTTATFTLPAGLIGIDKLFFKVEPN